MAKNGFFTGLDIGTSTIKVLVAEFVNQEMNVIGVSNAQSSGVKDGIIIDIDAAAQAIRTAIQEAEDKAGISIDAVSVGLPADQLGLEPAQGMIPVQSQSKEITDEDVSSVVQSALTKSITPEKEVISIIPQEFMIDGFKNIRDPRGMMGVRLEMRGMIYTGPTTILHNLRSAVERAGVSVENIIITPLSLTQAVLNEGEREFGAVVIDMGGGQTTVDVMANNELKFTKMYSEGGDYVTRDISKVLKTSIAAAEALKFNFGEADSNVASESELAQVEVVGSSEPVEVSERYISEIIEARLTQLFDRIKQDLTRNRLLNVPGGVVLVGGGAIMPGVVELAQRVLGVNVRLYVPNQVGIRNPLFANVISLVDYIGRMSDVERIAQETVTGEEALRRLPVEVQTRPVAQQTVAPVRQVVTNHANPSVEQAQHPQPQQQTANPKPAPVRQPQNKEDDNKPKLTDRLRGMFGSMFD